MEDQERASMYAWMMLLAQEAEPKWCGTVDSMHKVIQKLDSERAELLALRSPPSFSALLELFFVYWDRRAKRGTSSPLDRGDVLILEIFVEWLEETAAERRKDRP